ncbi:hypothetical protein B0H14DRAFT_1056499 [Mycena olivaceomarginata]|nr:hypothetical protein B0H14DRAFT_1056499 [Mycena olivaceomarginata]
MFSPRRNLYTEASGSYLIRILSFLCFTLIHSSLCFICSPLALYARSTHTDRQRFPTLLTNLLKQNRKHNPTITQPFLATPVHLVNRVLYRGLLCAYSTHGAAPSRMTLVGSQRTAPPSYAGPRSTRLRATKPHSGSAAARRSLLLYLPLLPVGLPVPSRSTDGAGEMAHDGVV